jgi:zinc transport system ATP-binding protein
LKSKDDALNVKPYQPKASSNIMAEQLLSLTNVCKGYAGKQILDDVSLSLTRGQITTLIGPNGAGKSTLAKIVLGLVPSDSGSRHCAESLRIGYMPQRLVIDASLPLSTIGFLELTSRPTQECLQALDRVGLAGSDATPIQRLSGGELQRALLARAILSDPDLLVLDEPVQGVDISGQTQLYTMISDLAKQLNCGVLMISHDLHLVMSSTDHVICLNQHICCHGRPEQVTQDPAFINIFGRTTAVYTHHHDHDHSLKGDVIKRSQTDAPQ